MADSGAQPDPPVDPSGAPVVAEAPVERRDALTEQDRNEIRLLLQGDSIVDWHRLELRDPAEVRRLLRLSGIDIADPTDRERLDTIRERAVRYLTKTLRLRLDPYVAQEASVLELPLVASGNGKHQRHACVVLKVMHIIHHLDARELLTALPMPINELFARVEAAVMRMFDELRAQGMPVSEFAWSRKTRTSLITKLLVKRETSAAQVFDRLRFRLVVARHEDLLPTIHAMLSRCIPFNYVVPGQTVNNLVEVPGDGEESQAPAVNEFSAEGYRVLNFVADLPIRIDDLFTDDELQELASERGRVVFVLAEFQIVDAAALVSNETGDSAHAAYKRRQHQRVRERLLRGPRGDGRTDSESERE